MDTMALDTRSYSLWRSTPVTGTGSGRLGGNYLRPDVSSAADPIGALIRLFVLDEMRPSATSTSSRFSISPQARLHLFQAGTLHPGADRAPRLLGDIAEMKAFFRTLKLPFPVFAHQSVREDLSKRPNL